MERCRHPEISCLCVISIEHPLLALAIFILTYVFIAIQNIPGLHIDRPAGVTIGSTLLILTGLLTIRDAYSFIDWDVITFLLGMAAMIAYLEFAGSLTLVGSVANLIVAEKAQVKRVRLSFMEYLKVGLPVTILTLLVGVLWIFWLAGG